MPSLGADMDAGTLIAWHMAVGDHVRRGDIVAEVDTDKSVIDVETFTTGTVERLLVEEGARVPVGTPLALIRADAEVTEPGAGPAPEKAVREDAPEGRVPERQPTVVPAAEPLDAEDRTPYPAVPAEAPVPVATRRPAASPLARRHAGALGVDLADVTGTGPGGAITTADVEHHAQERAAAAEHHPRRKKPARAVGPPAPPVSEPGPAAARGVPVQPEAPPGTAPSEAVPRSAPSEAPPRTEALAGKERQAALRRAVAASMARSKREVPHYYLSTDVDVGRAVAWLTARNEALPVTERLLPAALLLKATALALRETPDLNGVWESGEFHASDHVHLGVAIALRGGGLVAPAIHDADTLGLAELMAALRDLVGRARAGRLRSSEMADPTVTVTNFGDQGVDVAFPVIYPPQVAIVGFGRIRERPWAVDGLLGVRPVLTATLAADHRVTDGHRGALFLTALERQLQAPETL